MWPESFLFILQLSSMNFNNRWWILSESEVLRFHEIYFFFKATAILKFHEDSLIFQRIIHNNLHKFLKLQLNCSKKYDFEIDINNKLLELDFKVNSEFADCKLWIYSYKMAKALSIASNLIFILYVNEAVNI